MLQPSELKARILVTIGLAGALVGACTTAPQTEVVADVEFGEGQLLDVHFPDQPGPWPTVVLVHGAGLQRGSYDRFAELLAESGAVVFNTDWRVLTGHVESSLEDIACAVRYAKQNAPRFGGDATRTVLVGHSTGAVYAGEVATNGDAYTGECGLEGSALTEGLALISPGQVPGGRPWSHRTLGLNPDLRISIIHGAEDTVARPTRSLRTADLLEEAGYEVESNLVESGHYALVLVDLAGEEPDEVPEGHPARITAGRIIELAAAPPQSR